MESHILLVLVLIIVFLFFITRCNLSCPCGKNENYSRYLHRSLGFGEHPSLIKRKEYQPTLAPAPSLSTSPPSGGDVDIHTNASCSNNVCYCAQCKPDGTCTSMTCPSMDDARTCCNTPGKCKDLECKDAPCDYATQCKDVHFNSGNGGDGDDGGMSDKIWFIVGISILVAGFLGVIFYYWWTTPKSS